MFNLFKTKKDTIAELESQIDPTKYQLVQGKDGSWAYKEWFCEEWLLITAGSSKNKLKVLEYLLECQQKEDRRKKEKLNFS